MLRPYDYNPNNAVYVIGHDNEFVQSSVRKMKGNLAPRFFYRVAQFGQVKDTFLAVRADCDEIRSGRGVIITRQADGASKASYRLVA
jgi:hypothetical protein